MALTAPETISTLDDLLDEQALDVGLRALLQLGEGLAHSRDGAHGAYGLVDARGANLERDVVPGDGHAAGQGVALLVREDHGLCAGQIRHGLVIVQRDATLKRQPGDGAVHGAGVEVVEPQHLGHFLGHGGLSRARRPVDGDDHAHTPRVVACNSLIVAVPWRLFTPHLRAGAAQALKLT